MNTSTQAAGSNGVERRPALHGAAEFVSWTWEMINGGVECGWSPDGTEIVVSNPEKLQADVIPVYFRHGQVPVGPCPSTNPNPNPTLILTLPNGSVRSYNFVSLRLHASPYISLRLPTSPYVSLRPPTPPYTSPHLPTSRHISRSTHRGSARSTRTTSRRPGRAWLGLGRG